MATTLAEAVDACFAASNQMLQCDIRALEAIWSTTEDIKDFDPTPAKPKESTRWLS